MIKDLLIRPSSSYEQVIVEIEFDNLDVQINDFIFSLERSETEDGPWTYISDDITLNYMTDDTVDSTLFRAGVSLFYRVSILDTKSANIYSATKELMIESADRFALTIETNYKRYLDAQDMTEFTLFRRSKLSEFCECFNDVRMESEDPDCPICGGTGRKLGYLMGHDMKVSIINPISQETLVKELFGEVSLDLTSARAWTLGEYKIATEDLLMNKFSNELFEVSTIAYSVRGNYIIRQAMTMTKIEIGDPLYKFIQEVIKNV